DCGPRSPGFWRVKDAEAALEAGPLGVSATRKDLAPKVTLQRAVVSDSGAIAFSCVRKDRAALVDVWCPNRAGLRVEAFEEFVSLASPDFSLRHSGKHHAVGGCVGAIRVRRVKIDETIPGLGVVLAEVEEGRAPETGAEFP